MTDIRTADLPQDLPAVRGLFMEYARSLNFDLCFQDFDSELAALPGKYAAPGGTILLAWKDGKAVGCVAMRPVDERRCEMKRLYVCPEVRGEQLGARLVREICQAARAAAYTSICLDTVPSMTAALALYAATGFKPTDPYVFNPIEGAIFLALEL